MYRHTLKSDLDLHILNPSLLKIPKSKIKVGILRLNGKFQTFIFQQFKMLQTPLKLSFEPQG